MEFMTGFEPHHGTHIELANNISRVTAPNSGPFTFHGTNSYIVGNSDLMIIDPGPINDQHFELIVKTIGNRPVSHVLVTHTHADHSPLALRFKQKTGALMVGFGPHSAARALQADEVNMLDASADKTFIPDISLNDGETISNSEVSLQAIHTPGHVANHLCFALKGTPFLFSGDHVMAWATTIVAPPDGSMSDYLESLDKLRKRRETVYLPGHGGPVTRPGRFLRALKSHRLMREAAILALLDTEPVTIPDIVAIIYRETDKRLHGAAALTVFAHLERLITLGVASAEGVASLQSFYFRGGK